MQYLLMDKEKQSIKQLALSDRKTEFMLHQIEKNDYDASNMPTPINDPKVYNEINENVSTSLFIQGIVEKLSTKKANVRKLSLGGGPFLDKTQSSRSVHASPSNNKELNRNATIK